MNKTAAIEELQQQIALYEDMKAYSRLYELLAGGLHRWSYSIVKSNEAAEEIVSDVFIKIWQMRSKLAEIDNLRVYAYTIAKNFSLNWITKNYKHSVVSLESMDIETLLDTGGPDQLCISADLVRQIRTVINKLPPQCKLIFQLVKEDGFQYKEVASILDLSPLTVRNQLAIAIRKIGEALPAYIPSFVPLQKNFSRT